MNDINNNIKKYNEYIETIRRQFCISCLEKIKNVKYYYVVNPPGGFGRQEILICTDCLQKPENERIYKILLDRGSLEKQDIKDADTDSNR